MRYYPMYVNLAQKKCLVVGSGQVGRRKIATLATSGPAEVLVVDTAGLDDSCRELLDNPVIKFEQREFRPEDLDGRFLVIASTSSEELNWEISRLCQARNILCNIVDQPEKCGFIVPALYAKGDLTVAISTGGASPALARKIRKDLDSFFGTGYAQLLLFMSRLRPVVLDLKLGTEENSRIFRELVNSDLLDLFEQNDLDGARAVMQRILPPTLGPTIEELLGGLS